jgi:general secretion pathway protein L
VRETFYLRLGETADSDCEYGIAGADPRSLRAQRGSLDQALDRVNVAGRRVVVFVPATQVRLATVKVPARQPSKVLQAVPYALEDQVAEDVESLHFAVGTRLEDASHPVAILSRARLNQILLLLRANGVQPDWLVPETLALAAPTADGAWSALADGDHVCVRSGLWSAFTCAAADLVEYLSLADPDRTHPLRLHIAGNAAFDGSRLDWPVQLLPERNALAALATGFQPERAINLLQGSYAPRRDIERYWKPWRVAAVLLVSLIGVSLISHLADTWALSAEVARQDQANATRFQQLFPEQTRVVDLSAQLDQQIRALGAGAGSAGPLSLFEPLSQALAASPGLKLTGLQYREGALFLSMTATDLQVLENLRNWFAQRPDARLEVQSANAESGAVQIRARLSRA